MLTSTSFLAGNPPGSNTCTSQPNRKRTCASSKATSFEYDLRRRLPYSLRTFSLSWDEGLWRSWTMDRVMVSSREEIQSVFFCCRWSGLL